jgi:hypothetical protein
MNSVNRYVGIVFICMLDNISTASALEMPKFFGESPPTSNVTQDCPVVFIDNGASMIRMPQDADASSVRYQLSIDQTARECLIEGENVSIKLGIEGGVVLGPAGAPGAFTATISVALRRLKDYSLVSSKSYQVSASVSPGGPRGDYRLLADPISVPLVSKRAHEDYEIIVGFSQGGSTSPAKPVVKKKKSQPEG